MRINWEESAAISFLTEQMYSTADAEELEQQELSCFAKLQLQEGNFRTSSKQHLNQLRRAEQRRDSTRTFLETAVRECWAICALEGKLGSMTDDDSKTRQRGTGRKDMIARVRKELEVNRADKLAKQSTARRRGKTIESDDRRTRKKKGGKSNLTGRER